VHDLEPSSSAQVLVLAAIDKLLAEVGSDKSRFLMAQIFIAGLTDFAGVNAVWDARVAPDHAPCRTTSRPLSRSRTSRDRRHAAVGA
jgi:enamine deaminase RidA (YjgF/YER057c/UK114 family)